MSKSTLVTKCRECKAKLITLRAITCTLYIVQCTLQICIDCSDRSCIFMGRLKCDLMTPFSSDCKEEEESHRGRKLKTISIYFPRQASDHYLTIRQILRLQYEPPWTQESMVASLRLQPHVLHTVIYCKLFGSQKMSQNVFLKNHFQYCNVWHIIFYPKNSSICSF